MTDDGWLLFARAQEHRGPTAACVRDRPCAIEAYFARLRQTLTILQARQLSAPGTACCQAWPAGGASCSVIGTSSSRSTPRSARLKAEEMRRRLSRVHRVAAQGRSAAGRLPVRRCRFQRRRGGHGAQLTHSRSTPAWIGFDDPGFNETEFAKMVADWYKTNHRVGSGWQ